MSDITFQNAPIWINGVTKLASQASISEKTTFERREELGLQSVKTVPTSRPLGSFSATYYLSDDDSDIRGLTGINFISGAVGGYGFYSGLMTTYSINVEPNAVIQASLAIDFYSKINREMATGASPTGGLDIAHGGASIPSGLSFNTGMHSFSYEISQAFTPFFQIGSVTGLISAERTDGSITCSLNGSGLADALDSNFCGSGSGVNLSLRTVCGDEIGTISETGMQIADCRLSLSAENEAVGTINLIKYF